jgi:hypothetical protein
LGLRTHREDFSRRRRQGEDGSRGVRGGVGGESAPGDVRSGSYLGSLFRSELPPLSRGADAIFGANGLRGGRSPGNITHIATPIFRSYSRFGYAVYRQLVANCLRRFVPDPLVRADVPSTAQVTMTEQPGRRIVRVLSYSPERRTPELDIVEDVIPLAQVKLAARLDRRPRQVYLAPQRQTLNFDYRDGYARTTVPGRPRTPDVRV